MDSIEEHLAYSFPFVLGFTFIYLGVTEYALTRIEIFPLVFTMILSPIVMDLDHRHSKFRFYVLGFSIPLLLATTLVCNYGFCFGKVSLFLVTLVTLSFFTPVVFNHRGFFHSWSFAILFGFGLFLVTKSQLVGLVGLVGCFTHLLADKIVFKLW